MFIRKGSCEKSDSASNENLPSMFESHMDGQMFSDSITEVLGAQWPIGEGSFLLAEGKPAFLQQCFFQDFYHTGGPSYICVYIYIPLHTQQFIPENLIILGFGDGIFIGILVGLFFLWKPC